LNLLIRLRHLVAGIGWTGKASRLPQVYARLPVEDFAHSFLCTDFVDAHVHFPQYRMRAAPGVDLLDWLARFTFAEERLYRSESHAQRAAKAFLDCLVAHGTISAVVYSLSHKVAAQ